MKFHCGLGTAVAGVGQKDPAVSLPDMTPDTRQSMSDATAVSTAPSSSQSSGTGMCVHDWSGVRSTGSHAFTEFVLYVRCRKCNAVGFRKPVSHVVYTWGREGD